MRDIDRLEDEFRTGRLLRPSVDVLNVVDLGNAMASAAGASVRPMTKGAETVAGLIGPADHLVLVVADGFGMALVESLDAGTFPRRHAAATLHTVFPSTTASAFTSMATGEWPSRHAAVGWYTYVPQVDAVTTIIPFLRSIDDSPLTELGLTVSEALPIPSLLTGMARPSLSFLPEPLEGSTFSAYLSGGTPRRGYSSLAQAVEAIAARVRTAPGPTFTYLYVPHVDYAGHELGFSDPRTLATAAEVGRVLEALAEGLAGQARIVMTADHGGLDAGGDDVHLVGASDPLMGLLEREPSGDSRVVYFHVRQGEETRFQEAFRDRFGGRFLLITVDEAEEMELLGPGRLSDETRRRLGALVAVSLGADVFLYGWPSRSKEGKPFVGHHSGLSPAEVLVPLIVA